MGFSQAKQNGVSIALAGLAGLAGWLGCLDLLGRPLWRQGRGPTVNAKTRNAFSPYVIRLLEVLRWGNICIYLYSVNTACFMGFMVNHVVVKVFRHRREFPATCASCWGNMDIVEQQVALAPKTEVDRFAGAYKQ